MEPFLAHELTQLGGLQVKETRAGVSFQGNLETAYKACLWSRVANRILLPLKTVPAANPEKLYGGVRSIRWSDHLSPQTTIAVDFSTSQSQITHSHFGALKVKDAIVDQLRDIHGERPSVDSVRPDVRINVYLFKDEASVSIDLSGNSLHMRGYREEGAFAPLKENLAAALLYAAEWPKMLKEASLKDLSFIDPLCGSGTICIEAAMMAANRAPGLNREYFGFLGWLGHVPAVWNRVLKEAQDAEITDRKILPRIVGYDRDFRAVRIALQNVERAGLHGRIHVEKRELAQAEKISEKGMVVTNPPYGERLGEVEELRPLYKELGDVFKQKFKGWEGYIFTGSPELAKVIGLKAARRFVLFNGPLECRLFKYSLYEGSRKLP